MSCSCTLLMVSYSTAWTGRLSLRIIAPTWLAYSVSIHALLSTLGTLTRRTPPARCPKLVRLTQFRKLSGFSAVSSCCLICSQGFIYKVLQANEAQLSHSFSTRHGNSEFRARSRNGREEILLVLSVVPPEQKTQSSTNVQNGYNIINPFI